MASRKVISSKFPYSLLRSSSLDTGFDGHVAVPANLFSNGHPPEGYLPWTLADGTKVLAPAYLGVVKIKGIGSYSVIVTLLGDEIIVGRGLTDRFSLILDHGRKLILEP